ncbi:hypothetical protein KC332_g6072 [Hortaea werneckii]|nr:hypothetical protein KC358_g5898 [Hortaea werneckii]KAI6841819.1 hypothetical protein KC350_g5175 [Hortaea werneckii]KAI6935629.1 hypothetical protein KC348_g6200 [Hortaea werneckii]KAI6937231.1 hypothetical protein KC341_g5710 [Hortaea werneckii]KAI6970051.1 hypothetical protein KC321_g7539 [Hortaea werneckii]
MKLLHSCFLAICNGVAVSAWYDTFVSDSFNGITPLRRWYNISDARQSPNFTTSTSFPIGPSLTWQYWILTVSLSEVPAQGENATVVPDPRVLFTFYDLHPPGNWTDHLDSGLPMPAVYDDEDEPVSFQFESRMTYWPFSTSATNAYNGQGNCAGVVDLECIRQLETNDTAVFGDTPACPSVSPRWGGTGVVQFVQRPYLNESSAYRLGGFISGVYSAGNRSLIERELNRVHLAVVSGTETHALCLRFKENEVNSSNPGTGPAPSSSPNPVQATLWIVMASTVLCIFL